MTKKKIRLDFWFWVKVLVVGIMLLFLIYPFCTLITKSSEACLCPASPPSPPSLWAFPSPT